MSTKGITLPPLTGDTSWIDNPTGMEGLPVPVAPARPNSGGLPSLPSIPSVQDVASKIGGAVKQSANAIGKGVELAMKATPLAGWFGVDLEDVVFILLGLILLAAAAFSFKTVQTAGREFTRSAIKSAKAAAVAAEV
jgi:hypothetical protein